MTYMPHMLQDCAEVKHRVITYLSVHNYKFSFFEEQVRVTCPNGTIYHYNGPANKYQMLAGKGGNRLSRQPILSCNYFIEFMCNVLALHNPQLIFPTIKILISFHEKEYIYTKKE